MGEQCNDRCPTGNTQLEYRWAIKLFKVPMVDSAEINADVHQGSLVIQKPVDVLKNVPQAERDTVVPNIVMLSHMVKIANLNAFVARMHLTAMYVAENANVNLVGLVINAIKSALKGNTVIIALKNVNVLMENAPTTQVCEIVCD